MLNVDILKDATPVADFNLTTLFGYALGIFV